MKNNKFRSMALFFLAIVLVYLFWGMPKIFASELPLSALKDHRIKRILYDANNVVKVEAAKGVSLLILLDPSEKIDTSSSGLQTNCKIDEGAEWCIVARKGDNSIWVKPFSNAKYTDLQLKTDSRVYSFEFTAVPMPKKIDDAPVFRISFDYPSPPVDPHAAELTVAQLQLIRDMQTKQKINQPKILEKRNTNYTMQIVGDSSAIAPSETFDDGRFTYLRFSNNRDVPAVFTIQGDGSEKQVTKFWEKDTDYLVVEKVYKKLVLRKDKLTVGIFNESFDSDGLPPIDGTTIKNIQRQLKVSN